MGVGPVPPDEDPADYVLNPFTAGQRPAVEGFIRRAVLCIEDLVYKGFDRTMSLYNAAEPDGESD
jgi:peptidyl-tRNA hydrolase